MYIQKEAKENRDIYQKPEVSEEQVQQIYREELSSTVRMIAMPLN